jgi:uncharacterized protein YecT (DUF1311 family)
MDIEPSIVRNVGTLLGRSIGIVLTVLFFVWVRQRFGTVGTVRNSPQPPKLDDIIVSNGSRASESDDATFFEDLPKAAENSTNAEAKSKLPLLVPSPAHIRLEKTRTQRSDAPRRWRACAYRACLVSLAAGVLAGAFFSVPIMARLGLRAGIDSPTPKATITPLPGNSRETTEAIAPVPGAKRVEPLVASTLEEQYQHQRGSCDTTLDMLVCIGSDYQRADRDLNKVYNELMQTLAGFDDDFRDLTRSPSQETMLRDAQRAWIVFRDKECERVYWSEGGGTIAPILRLSCLVDLTEKRTTELRAYVHDSREPEHGGEE